MKNMLLPLSFLLLASTLTLVPETARASGNPVLDVNGFGLLPGVPYYMVSSQWPIGGGVVSLGGDINGTCPLDVILLENFCVTGTPVTFSIASGEGLFITDSTDIYISFDTTSNCTNETMVWMHESFNSSSAEFLTVGGVEGDVNTIFRIVNLGGSFVSSYKLVAYKLSSYDLALTTSNVGAVFDSTTGIRYLALTETPLIVEFQVAYGSDGLKAVV
ncbi:hypothetical protein SADUNF_Sadunf19G0095600 [Salix dunnii]|uniref:Kunitz trypsin inhibitor n=1 Tax=Salix dunnii TaxID=1413687 RepID=A0A835J2X5_9ROSI|nr:hypothetical protein SADUNF_Sadunf19G0095600 [Salix dunnii]